MQINSHILKISGNAELPNELILGNNYETTLQGTVVKSQDSNIVTGKQIGRAHV